MSLFEWEERYSVGVGEFDAQHIQLVRLLNELSDAMLSGKGHDLLSKTLDSLVEYTKTHFTNEERKMQQAGYPDFAAHKEEHEKLMVQAADLQKRVKAGSKPTVETMQFLKGWLINHILKTDKNYTQFLNAHGVR